MKFTPRKINSFLAIKLPAAFLSGVRLKSISKQECITSVKHRWINQNPFASIYFAVQAMAAELSTGALVMLHIKENGEKISMLVANQNGKYTKKATGRINFKCEDGQKVLDAIALTKKTGEGVTFWMISEGRNLDGELVSTHQFEWRIKLVTK